MANECRRVWGVASLATPARRTACCIARCSAFSSAWCRRTAPERGSTERVRERNTYCHADCRGRPDTAGEGIGEIGLAVTAFQIRLVEP